MIDEPSWKYSASENILSFSGIDLMANLTGDRKGIVSGIPTKIFAETSIRSAVLNLLSLGGVSKYVVEENETPVPIDIVSELGDSIYDILSQLRDITPNWQIYFDVDGIFHYEPISNGTSDPVLIDDDIWDIVKTEESVKIPFSSVKNTIEVWGQSISVSNYGDATISGSTYNVTIDDVTSLYNNSKYGFTAPSIVASPYLNINNLGAKRILNEDGTVAVIPEDNEYYVVQYNRDSDTFTFLGYQQVHATAQDTNPESPFYINGSLGILRNVLSGGDYNNIITKELCQTRANWELYLSTSKQDSVDIACVPVYFLDVNILSSYTNKDNDTRKYMIKSISTDLSSTGTQTVNMIAFYENYPYIQ